MEADSTLAFIENLKMINNSLDKINGRLEVLENDFRERSMKKKFLKWLMAFYPFVIVVLLVILDADHHKISEVASDVNELVNDTKSLMMYASNEEN